jgi:hypothetical protein
LAKASFRAELGLVLRSEIAIALMAAPEEHSHKTEFSLENGVGDQSK